MRNRIVHTATVDAHATCNLQAATINLQHATHGYHMQLHKNTSAAMKKEGSCEASFSLQLACFRHDFPWKFMVRLWGIPRRYHGIPVAFH